MNFTTDPRKLASAVSWAARRVPARPDVPILAGILIEIDHDIAEADAVVSFTGFDFEVSATSTLVADTWRAGGRAVVSGRLLAELVKSLPPKPVTIAMTDDESELTLTCGSVRATLPLMPAEEYPSLPTAPEPIGHIHAHDFGRELGRVLPACDIGMAQAVEALTGVLVVFSDVELSMAATNRYQLACTKVGGWEGIGMREQDELRSLIPGSVLAEVLKVCDFDGPHEIGMDGTAVSFSTGQRVIVSRTLDAKGFPNFASRIPARAESPTVIDVDEVTTALKRAAMVLDGSEPVRLAFEGETLTMRAGSGKGQVTAELECQHYGPEVEITVNPQYFATAIGSTGDTAELTITGQTLPILVTAPKDADYVHVMMPIRAT